MKWIDSENKKWDDPISIKTNESIFEEIIATLEKKDNIVVNDKFFTKTEMFDNIRNENWRTVFPELAEILDE